MKVTDMVNEVILSNAIYYGYEVEKEPLYYIKLPSTYNTFLVESDDGDLIVWQNTDRGTLLGVCYAGGRGINSVNYSKTI